MSFKITEKRQQNWILTKGATLQFLYENLNDVTQQMIKKHKNCSIDGFSFTYNSDEKVYAALISFVSDLE